MLIGREREAGRADRGRRGGAEGPTKAIKRQVPHAEHRLMSSRGSVKRNLKVADVIDHWPIQRRMPGPF